MPPDGGCSLHSRWRFRTGQSLLCPKRSADLAILVKNRESTVLHFIKSLLLNRIGGFSRRDLFRHGGSLALAGSLQAQSNASASGLRLGSDIYSSIGVRPIINCRGTLTIIGGSLELPEVRQAKELAAQHYIQLDELMDAAGKRLAELTGAEWGVITSGCAAALAHATAACVAGANPDLHVRIPNLAGFAKDEVIIPKHSRNVYDAAIRSVGVRIIEVGTMEEFEAALGLRTAMIYIFAGPRAEKGPLAFEAITPIAKQHNVPVLVDAAAEVLTIPNVHLQRGATLVGYSGGKCLRGPQCAGMLLGRKDLIQSAWIHSAPHHGYGRAMKIGKEEIIGMLMAVEMWTKRDHKAEWSRWLSWLDHIAKRVSTIDGVTTRMREAKELSNRSPSLTIQWDSAKLGITGEELSKQLYDSEPRIALGAFRRPGTGTETSISITAYMMSPGDEKIVADKTHAVLSTPHKRNAEPPRPPSANIGGAWDVQITFVSGSAQHTLFLQQDGQRIQGTHQGDFVKRDLTGTMDGDSVEMHSFYGEEHGDQLSFTFSGKVTGDAMSGTLDMGEYRTATWTARRHQYGHSA